MFSASYKESWVQKIPEGNRIAVVSFEDFEKSNFDQKLPCIISNLEWTCMDWTPELLQHKFEEYIHICRYGSGAIGDEKSTLSLPLKEYIQSLFIDNDPTQSAHSLPVPKSSTEKVCFSSVVHASLMRLSCGSIYHERRYHTHAI